MPEELRNEEEEAAFELEFSRMLQESLDSRKTDRRPTAFDVAIPTRVKFVTEGDNGDRAAAVGEDSVAFALLTKRGNKQQLKAMALPKDSQFALSTKIKQEEEMEEKQQLKRLVLNYEEKERE
ncbi:hypothetical protein HK405_001883, partial [Cladochytrium tenue]